MRGFVITLALVAGCGQSVVGRECVTEPCPRNFVCALNHGGERICTFACDSATATVCIDGSVCLPWSGDGMDTCYPGGNVTYGGSCSSTLDCVHGGVCIGPVSMPGSARCFRGCNFGSTPDPCNPASYCVRAIGGTGYCPS